MQILRECCGHAVQTEAAGGVNPKSPGRPRFSGIGHVYAGLSDEEVEVSLRHRHPNLILSPHYTSC